jgi:hypothetical protein
MYDKLVVTIEKFPVVWLFSPRTIMANTVYTMELNISEVYTQLS